MLALAEKYLSQTNRHVFLTGKAGTGKTTFLRKLVKESHKKVVVVAPTGIAAINAGGVTMHSFFQLPFGTFIPEEQVHFSGSSVKLVSRSEIKHNFKLGGVKQRMIKELELLIVDEVSMLRADVLDAMDYVLRFTRRKRNVPFGGVQVLFIGDLLQLPPVVKNDERQYLQAYYSSSFFFEALALKEAAPVYIELTEVFRQTNENFIALLNRFRTNSVSETDVNYLNQFFRPDFVPKESEGYITLTTHNNKADTINADQLRLLNGKTVTFKAKISGDFNEKSYPHPEELALKEGAQVMFVKNDSSGKQQFFNGKIGWISRINSSSIEVDFRDGSPKVQVEEYQWENVKYELDANTGEIVDQVIGTFTQYPVKLAWAITVHKSQGLTFEKAILDLEGAFAAGQVYVALSRLRSLDGLILKSPINLNSLVRDGVVQHYADQHDQTEKELTRLADVYALYYFRDYLLSVYDFSALLEDFKNHVLSYGPKGKNKTKSEYQDWAMDLYKTLEQLGDPSVKFQNQINKMLTGEKEELPFALERNEAAIQYFEPKLHGVLNEVKTHISDLILKKGMKGYLVEVKSLHDNLKHVILKLKKGQLIGNSLKDNKVLSKMDLPRNEAIEGISITGNVSKSKTEKVSQNKGDSKKLSLQLYLEGLAVQDIAKKRNLSIQTIENHLIGFVKSGEVNAHDFVSKEKQDLILTKSKQIKSAKLSELKAALPDDVSYSEIRFSLA